MPTAWDLIGFDGSEGLVRIKGGRTLYEAVDYNDARGGQTVKLARLVTVIHNGQPRLRQINRYVDPDTELEVIPDNA